MLWKSFQPPSDFVFSIKMFQVVEIRAELNVWYSQRSGRNQNSGVFLMDQEKRGGVNTFAPSETGAELGVKGHSEVDRCQEGQRPLLGSFCSEFK